MAVPSNQNGLNADCSSCQVGFCTPARHHTSSCGLQYVPSHSSRRENYIKKTFEEIKAIQSNPSITNTSLKAGLEKGLWVQCNCICSSFFQLELLISAKPREQKTHSPAANTKGLHSCVIYHIWACFKEKEQNILREIIKSPVLQQWQKHIILSSTRRDVTSTFCMRQFSHFWFGE